MRKNNKMERQLDDIRVLVAEAKIRNNFNDDELAAYIGSVSYTHLDVYKRQVPSEPLPGQ